MPPDHLGDQPGLAVPPVAAGGLGQRGDVAELRQRLVQRPQLGLEAQVTLAAGTVVVGGLAGDAALGHGPQQRQDGRHPGAAADEDQVGVVALAQGEHPVRAAEAEPVPHLQRGVEEVGEQSVRVDLDHELELAAVPGRGIGHGERAGRPGPGYLDVHVLTREELDVRGLDQPQHQVPHVVGDRVLGHHLRDGAGDRQAGADHVLVVVEQLDGEVLIGVRPAQQRVAFLPFEVGQRERGVPVELDVLAVEHERLAGRALPLLAAVHEHDALLEGGAQDRLLLADLDLDADGLEAHHVLVAHDSLGGCAGVMGLGRPGGPGDRAGLRAGRGTGRGPPRIPRASPPWGRTGRPGRRARSRRGTPGAPRRTSG